MIKTPEHMVATLGHETGPGQVQGDGFDSRDGDHS